VFSALARLIYRRRKTTLVASSLFLALSIAVVMRGGRLTGGTFGENEAERVASLVEQVTGQVRWRETIEWFAANGVTTLYEIGAGKVLSGLARRIDRNIATVPVGNPAEIDAAMERIGNSE